jgi:hypothetical protein
MQNMSHTQDILSIDVVWVKEFFDNSFIVPLLSDTGASGKSSVTLLLGKTYKALFSAKKSLKHTDDSQVVIDEEKLREAIEIVNKQKIDGSSKASEITRLVQQCSIPNINQPPLNSHFSFDIGKLQSCLRKIYQAIKACLNVIRYSLTLIRRLLGIRLIDYLINALHRTFYIPHSTLHMPKNTDEDHSTAYNRFEQFFRAITGVLCLLPAT